MGIESPALKDSDSLWSIFVFGLSLFLVYLGFWTTGRICATANETRLLQIARSILINLPALQRLIVAFENGFKIYPHKP